MSHDIDVPCRDDNAKFIHDDISARIQTTMQMSLCRYAMMRMSSYGYVVTQML